MCLFFASETSFRVLHEKLAHTTFFFNWSETVSSLTLEVHWITRRLSKCMSHWKLQHNVHRFPVNSGIVFSSQKSRTFGGSSVKLIFECVRLQHLPFFASQLLTVSRKIQSRRSCPLITLVSKGKESVQFCSAASPDGFQQGLRLADVFFIQARAAVETLQNLFFLVTWCFPKVCFPFKSMNLVPESQKRYRNWRVSVKLAGFCSHSLSSKYSTKSVLCYLKRTPFSSDSLWRTFPLLSHCISLHSGRCSLHILE